MKFKGKVEEFFYPDGSLYQRRIKVPVLARRHCDMDAFRAHPKFGPYANSDFFLGMLQRAVVSKVGGKFVRLDLELPAGVSVDTSGFLAVVTVEL